MKMFVMIILAAANLFAQSTDPDLILQNVKNEFDKVEDYKADVNVKLEIDFLEVPETKAKIYFKRPNKTKLDSEGFALLPKQVFEISPSKLLEFDYTAIYIRRETMDETVVDIIKIIPNSDSTNMLLSTLWVDAEKNVVRKIEAATKNSGTILTELAYDKNYIFPLPMEIKVTFKMNDVNIPSANSSGMVNKQNNLRRRRTLEGTVHINYSNYIVNSGISDEIFKDDKTTE